MCAIVRGCTEDFCACLSLSVPPWGHAHSALTDATGCPLRAPSLRMGTSNPDDRVGGSAERGGAHVTPARGCDASAPVDERRTGRVAGSPMGSPEESTAVRPTHPHGGDGPSGPHEGKSTSQGNDRPRTAAVRSRLPAMTGRGTAASSASSPGPATQAPEFTANDCARLFQVITADENRSSVE